MIMGLQIRAARGALNWSVSELSKVSGVPTATIVRYEAADGVPVGRKGHLDTLKSVLEKCGIEFVGTPEDGPGIRVRRLEQSPQEWPDL